MAAQPARPSDEYLEGSIVAEVLGLRPSVILERARAGEGFPVVRLTQRRFFVRASDLDAWEAGVTVGRSKSAPGLSSEVRRLQRRRSALADRSPVLGPRPLGGEDGPRAVPSLR